MEFSSRDVPVDTANMLSHGKADMLVTLSASTSVAYGVNIPTWTMPMDFVKFVGGVFGGVMWWSLL